MSIIARKYILGPGSTVLQSPSLFGASVLGLWRESINYKQIGTLTSFTGAAEFRRVLKFGSIQFGNPGAPGGERIWIIYKI